MRSEHDIDLPSELGASHRANSGEAEADARARPSPERRKLRRVSDEHAYAQHAQKVPCPLESGASSERASLLSTRASPHALPPPPPPPHLEPLARTCRFENRGPRSTPRRSPSERTRRTCCSWLSSYILSSSSERGESSRARTRIERTSTSEREAKGLHREGRCCGGNDERDYGATRAREREEGLSRRKTRRESAQEEEEEEGWKKDNEGKGRCRGGQLGYERGEPEGVGD